jgi:hypothetical protein
MRLRKSWVLVSLIAAGIIESISHGQPAAGPIAPEQLPYLHKLIKPQPDEALWAKIPWLTNLDEAREKSIALDKPLFVWRAGGGEVLGRA